MLIVLIGYGQNTRITGLSEQGTATNNTYFVVDKLGWQRAKKMSLQTVNSLEETSREAQDDVIEAGCGLEADGTYAADGTTNYITAADFAAAGLSADLKNADHLLDEQIAEHRSLINWDVSVCPTGCDYTRLSDACATEGVNTSIIIYGTGGSFIETADITVKAGQKIYFDGVIINMGSNTLNAGGDASELYGTVYLLGGNAIDGKLVNVSAGYDELFWMANINLAPSGAVVGDMTGTINTISIDSDYSRFRFTMKDIAYDNSTGTNYVFGLNGSYSKYEILIDDVTQVQSLAFRVLFCDELNYCDIDIICNGIVNGDNSSDAIHVTANADYNTFSGVARENDDDIDDNGTGTETDGLNATIP